MDEAVERRSAWLASGYALGQLVLKSPVLLVLLGWAVALVLSLVGVGLYLVRALVPALVAAADLSHPMTERILGRPVRVERPAADGSLGPLRQVRVWAVDPGLWRHVGWMCFTETAGLLLSLVVLVLPLGAVALVVVPVVLTSVDPSPGRVLFLVLGTAGALVMAAAWWRYASSLVLLRARAEARILAPDRSEELSRQVLDLARSRAATVDDAAGELRRIERDLHDGAQVRLVALALQLGMAEESLLDVPGGGSARELLREARGSTTQALADVRDVVRGIHPPLLADRGLVGAVEALAGDLPLTAHLDLELPGRPPEAVESALYFATSECLANVVRHAGASRVGVRLRHDGAVLRAEVRDDGCGGALVGGGSGLSGIRRRLDAFDGTLTLSSEVGTPTVVTMEVPCALSSARTTHS